MKKSKNHEAKLAVAQVYWNADQEYKHAEARREHSRELALVALSVGETIGPVYARRECDECADSCGHWLTHGQKERVEMDAGALWALSGCLSGAQFVSLCTVNTALLKSGYPEIYAQMLKHPSTKRTSYDCLTWADKEPAAKAVRKRTAKR